MSLEVLYQDQWLIVIDKPAGMLVHPGREPEPSDQIAMKVLRDQIGHRVQTVHRLDRPTSGVLLFALDEKIEANLRKQFEQQEVRKRYRAVVFGEARERWTCCDPLQKNPEEPFREATTGFVRSDLIVLGNEIFSVLEVIPETGRHHQIRKHLSAGGYPIVGDYLYGEVERMDRLAALTGQSRLMLHAAELTFLHPVEGLEMSIVSPLPERFSPFVRAEM